MARLFKILGSLLLLLIVLAVALPFLVPVERLKGPVLAQIEAATGRKVSVGAMTLKVFPNIALDASDVKIGNPDWAQDKKMGGDMADIDHLKLGVKLMPLLDKRVEVTDVTLDKPVIALISENGHANWQFGNAAPKGQGQEAAAGSQNAATAQAFSLEHVAIKDGVVSYRDGGKTTQISDIDVKLSAKGMSDKASFDGSASYNGQKTSVAVAVENLGDLTGGAPAKMKVKASFGDQSFTWDGSYVSRSGRPALTGALDIPEIDTTKEEASGGKGGASPAPKSGHWSDAPINLSGLNAADADLNVTIGKLKLKQTSLSGIKARVQLAGGKLNFTMDELDAYSGKIRLALVATSGGGLSVSTSATGVALGALMKDFAGSEKLTGTLTASAAVSGAGSSERAIISSLGGKASFEIKDGTMQGADLDAMMHNVAGALTGGGEKRTKFSSLSGTFTIANGVADNKDLALVSQTLQANGAGTINLPAWQVHYYVKPLLVASNIGGKTQGITVPVRVEGDLDHPSYRPDLGAALTENLADPKALKGNLKQLKQNILSNPDALKGLLR